MSATSRTASGPVQTLTTRGCEGRTHTPIFSSSKTRNWTKRRGPGNLFDGLGSTTGLTDSTGALVRTYRYEPYGTQRATTGNGPQAAFRFASGYVMPGGLYHFGQRYMDPSTGRWTQQDPLDQTGDLREGDRYLYAGDDPVNLTDPRGTLFGLSQEPVQGRERM